MYCLVSVQKREPSRRARYDWVRWACDDQDDESPVGKDHTVPYGTDLFLTHSSPESFRGWLRSFSPYGTLTSPPPLAPVPQWLTPGYRRLKKGRTNYQRREDFRRQDPGKSVPAPRLGARTQPR